MSTKKTTQSCKVGVSIDVSSTDVNHNDSESARTERTPCKRPRPGKLYAGLSQCGRTCGDDAFWSLEKVGTKTRLSPEQTVVLTLMLLT